MPGCGTKNSIFILRQLHQKYLAKKKKHLHFAIIDLDKAVDLMLRDVEWLALKELGKEKWLVKIVQLMCRNVSSHVQVNRTFSDDILVQIKLH